MIKQNKERKPHDRHWPDATKGAFVVHCRKAGTLRKFWYSKLVEALDFVMALEGYGDGTLRPEKITQGRFLLWKRKEG